jgi:hypothetical protein
MYFYLSLILGSGAAGTDRPKCRQPILKIRKDMKIRE